jgi:hypothetical protein
MKPIGLFGAVLLVLHVILFCVAPLSGRAQSREGLSKSQTLYVPVYSHVYRKDTRNRIFLTATLLIRNTDQQNAITVKSVDYYDTDGELARQFLKKPITLDALATEEIVIREIDRRGGAGANFIVEWQSESFVNPPLVEAVMIGTERGQGISFISQARVLHGE